MRISFNKELGSLLKPQGFIKVKKLFIRRVGDIIQTVQFIYTPIRIDHCKGFFLNFAMASIYDHNIFGIVKDTHGYLSGVYSVDAIEFSNHLRNERRSTDSLCDEFAQIDIFDKYCLPFLNSVHTSRDLYEARYIMQTIFSREINFKLSPDTNLCLELGEYEEAIKRINAAYDYYSGVVKRRRWFFYDDIYSDIVKVKQLVEQGDRLIIEEYLSQEKQNNLRIYETLIPRRYKIQETTDSSLSCKNNS